MKPNLAIGRREQLSLRLLTTVRSKDILGWQIGRFAMKRKIAAILAADIVGYSKLVGEDEEETLRRLESYRAVFADFIARFGGRIFNTAGDAILAEFASALDAVRCAVDTQESLRTRNLSYPPSRQMNFRIGITIGDIVEREGDLLGEGVNIASRLEGIAPVGGICISRSVHEAVANKISLKFADLGEQQLKNLPDRVHAYTVTLEQRESASKRRQRNAFVNPIYLGITALLTAALGVGGYLYVARKVQPSNVEGSLVAAPPVKAAEPVAQLAASTPQAVATVPMQATGTKSKGNDIDLLQLAGDWKGSTTEDGGNTYNVGIALSADGKGTISYPDLGCRGTLEYLFNRGHAHVYREKITKGTKCGRGAEIELAPSNSDGSELKFHWLGQGAKLTGQLKGKISETETCLKYLPYAQVMIHPNCKVISGTPSDAPVASKPLPDIDPETLGIWILTVPRGRWVWATYDNGTYDFHSEASDGAPAHSGHYDAKDGQWSIQARSGYADGGTYEVSPSGQFIATGRLGTGAWQPAYPVRREH